MSDAPTEVVARLTNPLEAEMLRNALEAEEIACFLEGENQAALAGVLDIRVRVRANDRDRAEQIISEYRANQLKHTGDEEEADEDDSVATED